MNRKIIVFSISHVTMCINTVSMYHVIFSTQSPNELILLFIQLHVLQNCQHGQITFVITLLITVATINRDCVCRCASSVDLSKFHNRSCRPSSKQELVVYYSHMLLCNLITIYSHNL